MIRDDPWLRMGRVWTPHYHQCGHLDASDYKDYGLTHADGCGHIWKHEPGGEFGPNHRCPACGKGPWPLVYNGWTEDENGKRVCTAEARRQDEESLEPA